MVRRVVMVPPQKRASWLGSFSSVKKIGIPEGGR
jgi:hypothetical protein